VPRGDLFFAPGAAWGFTLKELGVVVRACAWPKGFCSTQKQLTFSLLHTHKNPFLESTNFIFTAARVDFTITAARVLTHKATNMLF
jgi:hypothetical protein